MTVGRYEPDSSTDHGRVRRKALSAAPDDDV
jgi:hypothetical protein